LLGHGNLGGQGWRVEVVSPAGLCWLRQARSLKLGFDLLAQLLTLLASGRLIEALEALLSQRHSTRR
jgi:hypothetical protein